MRPCALSHMEACGKNLRSMCCRALCGYQYGTWMLQDDRTAFTLQQTSLLHKKCRGSQEVEKAKTYQIGAKSKFVFNVFNLQAVLYYCCVYNLVVNYPMIIITPRNWYSKNAQFSNRMTGHCSPKSMVRMLTTLIFLISVQTYSTYLPCHAMVHEYVPYNFY